MTTTNLSEFRYRELELAEKLLRALREQGIPDDFEDDEIQIMMNKNSGYVFFTNSEYQVLMLNGEKLEMFYSTPSEGREGFFDDLMDEYDDMNREDKKYMDNLKKSFIDKEKLKKV